MTAVYMVVAAVGLVMAVVTTKIAVSLHDRRLIFAGVLICAAWFAYAVWATRAVVTG